MGTSFARVGQDIVVDANYSGVLTDLAHAPRGLTSLTGRLEELLAGRTTPTETGITSIRGVGDSRRGMFQVDRPFDVFVDLTLDTLPPLHVTRGPIALSADAPEPAGIAILATALLALLGAARGRVRRAA